jgi:hypothetical protein
VTRLLLGCDHVSGSLDFFNRSHLHNTDKLQHFKLSHKTIRIGLSTGCGVKLGLR